MMKNLRKHFLHYLIYLVIFGGGVMLVLTTRMNPNTQALVIMMTAFLYFMWAMVHHYIHHQLHARIVVLGTMLTLFLFGA